MRVIGETILLKLKKKNKGNKRPPYYGLEATTNTSEHLETINQPLKNGCEIIIALNND